MVNNKQFLLDEIARIPGAKKIQNDRVLIICSYHPDHNPSGSINLDELGRGAPFGWYRCWSCGTSVPWNELAKKHGLREMNGESAQKNEVADYIDPAKFKDDLLIDTDDLDGSERFPEIRKNISFYKFPESMKKWRGFKTDFIKSLGARYMYHEPSDEYYVFFPVMIQDKMRGYVRSRIEAQEGKISHLNAPGKWSSRYGLLFYDTAVTMMEEQGHTTIVLCEGPRDALRLLRFGIPAMAVLGAENWNENKRFTLEQTGAEHIIIFMDGDDAGKRATRKIKRDIQMFFNTRHMALWKHPGEFDPGNCPKHFLQQVKRNLI